MRVRFLILALPLLVFIQGGTTLGQSLPKLEYYANLYVQSNNSLISKVSDISNFAEKLENSKGEKDQKQFLKLVFNKTHHRFLKNYQAYATFSDLLKAGNYNCLTGTALYALLLDHLGYDYKVIETNYHIFLIVKTSEGKVIFEATDPVKGFITDADEVEKRLSKYQQNQVPRRESEKIYYQYSVKLFNEVSLDEMLGLLHYNHAIEAFNAQQLSSAIVHLDKAIHLYQSPRIDEFAKIILLYVKESKLEASVKENCLQKIQTIRNQRMHVIASSATAQKP